MKVENQSGEKVAFETAINYMDEELREELHATGQYETEQDFFTAYELAHERRFGKWALSKKNPTW